jgi:hypothetical protein
MIVNNKNCPYFIFGRGRGGGGVPSTNLMVWNCNNGKKAERSQKKKRGPDGVSRQREDKT